MKRRKSKLEDLSGKKFHKLTVIKKTDVKKHGTYLYKCICDCGTEKLVKRCDLLSGQQSCGCVVKERTGNLNKLPRGEAALNGLFYRYKTRAKKDELEFSITKDIFKILISNTCFYCNEKPRSHHFKTTNGDLTYNGLDRIDSSIGYIDSNVVTCCAECNWMKHVMDTKQFFEKILKIVKHHNLLKTLIS